MPEIVFFRSLAIAIRNWFTSILIVSAIVGCGCRGPERALPAPSDSQYKKIETMIERSLYPNIDVLAPDKKRQLTQVRELNVLATLGYFYRTSRGFYMPTERARKLSKHDDWPPMIGGPFKYRFNDNDHISLRIGSYSVLKLTSAAHYEGAPCGGFGDEADAYGFIGKLSLNALGRALLEKHLLYTRLNASSPIRQWDGHRPVHDIWSDNPEDVDTGYQDTISHGEYVTLKSALI